LLESKDAECRNAGLRVLGPAALSSLPVLLKNVADDPDETFRCIAAGVLSRSDPDSTSDILRRLARDPAPYVRVTAIQGLTQVESGIDFAWLQESLSSEHDAACRLALVNLMLRQPLDLSAAGP